MSSHLYRIKMTVIVTLVIFIMIGNHATFVSAGLSQGWRGFKNSVLRREVIIDGSKAEEIYLAEQLDQKKALENLVSKHSKLQQNAKSGKTLSDKEMATLNLLNVEFSKLSQELREEEFCSEDNLCDRAFENTFFSQRKYKLKTEAGAKPQCVNRVITLQKGDNKFKTGKRRMAQCDINYISGVKKVFLVPSTKYDREKNLKFFVLTKQNEVSYVPIAYLMNKKKDTNSNSQPTEYVKLPASSGDTDGNIGEMIAKDIEYTTILPAGIFTDDMRFSLGTPPPSPERT